MPDAGRGLVLQLLSQIMPPLQVFVTVRAYEYHRTGGIVVTIICGGSADLPFMRNTHVNTKGKNIRGSFTFLEGFYRRIWDATRDYQPTCSTTEPQTMWSSKILVPPKPW